HRVLVALDRLRLDLHGPGGDRSDRPALVAVPDLVPEARPEAALLRQLHAELVDEHARQLGARDEPAGDEDRAEALARLALLDQRLFELVLRDQSALDEELTERAPSDVSGFHAGPASASAQTAVRKTQLRRSKGRGERPIF